MRVSVVIPAYNEEHYIAPCLEALSQQTQPPAEIIVVDNNSTDNTIAIAKRFDVTILQEKVQGITHARNTGFNASQHEIIARCDADTRVPIDWIEKIVAHFEGNDIEGLTGPCYFYDVPNRRALTEIHLFTFFTSSRKALGHHTLFGSNMAITRRAWLKIRDSVCIDDKNMHEDMDIAIHINQFGGKICFDEKFYALISFRRGKKLATYYDYPMRWIKSVTHAKVKPRPSHRS